MNQKLQNRLIWIYFILPTFNIEVVWWFLCQKKVFFYVEKDFNIMQIRKKIKFENGIWNVTVFQNYFEGVQHVSKSIENYEAVFPISLSGVIENITQFFIQMSHFNSFEDLLSLIVICILAKDLF